MHVNKITIPQKNKENKIQIDLLLVQLSLKGKKISILILIMIHSLLLKEAYPIINYYGLILPNRSFWGNLQIVSIMATQDKESYLSYHQIRFNIQNKTLLIVNAFVVMDKIKVNFKKKKSTNVFNVTMKYDSL